MNSPRQKLFLHVGLPKTGTSALQTWCNKYREDLKEDGVIYPPVNSMAGGPKHQYVVSGLFKSNLTALRTALSNADDHGNILLSAEGMTNHLYDFRLSALSEFRSVTEGYDVHVFLVSRQVDSWTRSYYKQCVINPTNSEFAYGTALRYEEFAQLPRVRRLANIKNVVQDVAAAYGARTVTAARYEEDWMGELLSIIGAGQRGRMQLDQVNESVADGLIEPIRQLNGMGLSVQERNAWLSVIQHCFSTNHNILQMQGASTDIESRLALIDSRLLKRFTASNSDEDRVLQRLNEFVLDLTRRHRTS